MWTLQHLPVNNVDMSQVEESIVKQFFVSCCSLLIFRRRINTAFELFESITVMYRPLFFCLIQIQYKLFQISFNTEEIPTCKVFLQIYFLYWFIYANLRLNSSLHFHFICS